MKLQKLTSLFMAALMAASVPPLLTVDAFAMDEVAINSTNFPDARFRAYVAQEFDTDGNSSLSAEEISAVKYIRCNCKNISDFKGIEIFTDLKDLHCSDNLLTSLDVSKNTALTRISCSLNELTALDLSNNTALTELHCERNQLTALDLSKNTALKELDCSTNQLTMLDLSNNTELINLTCGYNQLTSLDISNSARLEYLDCNSNQLKALDVSNNSMLENLYCSSNQLTGIDVNNSTKLAYFICDYNKLTSLDVSNNTVLLNFSCNNNQLDSLDICKNTMLNSLSCNYNRLTNIDVSNNTILTNLDCNNNKLTSLDVSKNSALNNLLCFNNQLTDIDLSKNTALAYLYCDNNAIADIDLSNNTALRDLRCHKNQLTSLDVSKNTLLETLHCYNNQLTSLDLSKNTELRYLSCSSNQLTSLDISNTAVIILNADNNEYTLTGTSLNKLAQYGFDGSKASNWTGATYDAATNSLTNVTSDTITYSYNVGKGKSTTFSLNIVAEIKPTNLTATAGDGNVALVWDTASGASRYAVYSYTKTDGYKLIGTTSKRAYVVSGLTNGTQYGFLVRGYGNGTWSEFTKADLVYATPVSAAVVELPEITTITPGDGQVTLIWSKPEGAIKYAVYSYTKADGYKLIGTTSKNAYIVSGLTNGTAYGFLVRACGSNGQWSAYTKADNVYATPISAVTVGKPEITTITPGDGKMTLIWSKPDGAIKYALYTYTRAEGYKLIGTTSKNAYIVSGLTNGTAYGFLVRACGSNGVWSEYTKADNVYATPTA